MERWTFESQKTPNPSRGRPDNLHEPMPEDGGERGRNWRGHTRRSSVYTSSALHPARTAALLGAAGIGLAAIAAGRRASRT